jgi:predicted DNA-binding transcriptional regulator AlpA
VPKNREPPRTYTDLSDLPALLAPDDLAVLLRTSRRAIYAMAQRGQLPPALDLGQRRLLWERDAVLDWFAQRRATSRGDP